MSLLLPSQLILSYAHAHAHAHPSLFSKFQLLPVFAASCSAWLQVRSCTKDQIVARLREDRKLAAKFYRIAAVSIASRLAEISPLDIYL